MMTICLSKRQKKISFENISNLQKEKYLFIQKLMNLKKNIGKDRTRIKVLTVQTMKVINFHNIDWKKEV